MKKLALTMVKTENPATLQFFQDLLPPQERLETTAFLILATPTKTSVEQEGVKKQTHEYLVGFKLDL